jgi:kelch-like protein 1/4/5
MSSPHPSMPPTHKRSRAELDAGSSTSAIVIGGGHVLPPRIVAKYHARTQVDAILRARCGTRIEAHRLVLSAGSDYFESLWGGAEWVDSNGTLVLDAIDGPALKAVCDFLYEGQCSVADDDSLLMVIEAAAYLQVAALRDAATRMLQSAHLHAGTALRVWDLAERLSLPELGEAAARTSREHFAVCAADDAWLSAPVERVRALIADDCLVAESETLVYDAALRWLRAQSPPFGAAGVAALLSHVRFPQLPSDFIRDVVHEEPLLGTIEGMKMVARAMQDGLFGGASMAVRPRPAKMYACGGYAGRTALQSVERYDPATDTWETVAPMSMKRAGAGAAVLQDRLHVCGGLGGGSLLQSVERYDPATDTWETVAPMSSSRCHAGLVSM